MHCLRTNPFVILHFCYTKISGRNFLCNLDAHIAPAIASSGDEHYTQESSGFNFQSHTQNLQKKMIFPEVVCNHSGSLGMSVSF